MRGHQASQAARVTLPPFQQDGGFFWPDVCGTSALPPRAALKRASCTSHSMSRHGVVQHASGDVTLDGIAAAIERLGAAKNVYRLLLRTCKSANETHRTKVGS